MADVGQRRRENVEGDFYVDSTCIDCDLCRQISPGVFVQAGDQSAVGCQPRTAEEEFTALKALVTCPTASIGTTTRRSAKGAAAAYPEQIEGEVYFCGFAAESSFGASSYLIVREAGNVLVDSPRFARPLARRIAELGGIRLIFLTHIDDIADHELWSKEFGAQRIMHRADAARHLSGIERMIDGEAPVELGSDLLAIPTPGHTRGHTCLLYRERFLFTGDHVWWSPNRKALNASRSVCWYSWPEQLRSLEKLAQYRFEWVLPGHGRRFHAPVEVMREQMGTAGGSDGSGLSEDSD